MPDGLCQMNDPADVAPCEMLRWDSDFWGFPVARVNGNHLTADRVDAIDQWCAEHQVTCLYFLASFDEPETVQFAEDAGYRLVDTRVTATITPARFALLSPPVPGAGLIIRPAVEADLSALQRMAESGFPTTRFFFDRRFPRERCRQLYAHWITESCRGGAEIVHVADSEVGPLGYLTCHLPSGGERARIGLINVAAGARRRGVARELMRESLAWYAQRGVHEVVGVSQGRNIAVQAFNDRVGFITESCQIWYHKWFQSPGIVAK